MAETNGTPKSGARNVPAVESIEDLVGRAHLAMSAIGVTDDGPAAPLDRDAIGRVLSALVQAVSDPSPSWARTIRAMADIAGGAAKPGDTFNSDLVRTIELARSCVRIAGARRATEAKNAADMFLSVARTNAFGSKLLEGLDEDAAGAIVRDAFATLIKYRHRKPVGVVVDLLHAALQRGVRFDGGNLAKTQTRAQLATIADRAWDRAMARNADEK